MKIILKYLLLAGALLALVGCASETFQIRDKANLEAVNQCVAAGGLPKLDVYGVLQLCDFSLRDQLSTRPLVVEKPAAPKGGDTQ